MLHVVVLFGFYDLVSWQQLEDAAALYPMIPPFYSTCWRCYTFPAVTVTFFAPGSWVSCWIPTTPA